MRRASSHTRAGNIDAAERDITTALAHWPTPPAHRDRVPVAMCLYNRGLVAEARDDLVTAARAWRRSLELRPDRTVQARLNALGIDEPRPHDAHEEIGHSFTRDGLIAAHAEELGATAPPVLRYFRSERSHWLATHVHFELDPDDELADRCYDERVIVSGPGRVAMDIANVSACPIVSYLRHEVRLDEPRFLQGPAELGELVAVTAGAWGRQDASDGRAIESYTEATLSLCAERRDWACISVALSSVSQLDCEGSGGCADPDDPSDDPTDPDVRLPEPDVRGYALRWSIEGGDLVLAPEPTAGIPHPEPPPRHGRIPLVPLFDGP